MRIAFIGAGGIASNYLESLDGIDEVDVAAICDLDEERAVEAATPRNAVVYTDHRNMFDEAGFDALFVTIPPSAHTDQEILAARHGVDLFIAKPVARTEEKAWEVQSELVEHEIITQVGYMWRYSDITNKAEELLDDRTIGLLDGQVWVDVPPSDWWGQTEHSGGQIVEQASHIYDLVRYFGGDVAHVNGTGDHRLGTDAVDFEDVTSVTMRHENGAVAHVSTTCASPDHRYDLHLIADGARLHLDYLENKLTGVVDGEEIQYEGERDGYTRQIEKFVAACLERDRKGVRSDYTDGAETLRLTLSAAEAVETNESLPLQ